MREIYVGEFDDFIRAADLSGRGVEMVQSVSTNCRDILTRVSFPLKGQGRIKHLSKR